jgi:hypothetical protein
MNQYKVREHQRRLEKHLSKYPDQIGIVNSIITLYNTKYLPLDLRLPLIEFVSEIVTSSCKIDGIDPPTMEAPAKATRGGQWFNNGTKNIRVPKNIEAPPGFTKGRLKQPK